MKGCERGKSGAIARRGGRIGGCEDDGDAGELGGVGGRSARRRERQKLGQVGVKRIEGECCERKRGGGRGREVVDCGRVGWNRGGGDND